jgi:LCP family protein required for cell wall assembly
MTNRGRRYRPSQAVPPPRRRHRPRRLIPIRVYLLGIIALVLVVFGIGAVSLWNRAAAFNDRVSTVPAFSWDLFGPLTGDEPVNVAIYGYSGEYREGAYLTDSIIVVSIDRSTDVTTIVPIPRDLWVEGVGVFTGKINEAFRVGFYTAGIVNAGELTSESLELVTGLEIDGWIALEFEGFRRMVDALEGVTLENPVAFRYTWNEEQFLAGDFQHEFAAGTLELDGQQALDYARARYTSVPAESSDFARSVRQQRVLAAMKEKVTGGLAALGPGLRLMDAAGSELHTSLSVIDLYLLSDLIEPNRRILLEDGAGLISGRNAAGQYVLLPTGQAAAGDYSALHAYLRDELANPLPSPSPDPSASPTG